VDIVVCGYDDIIEDTEEWDFDGKIEDVGVYV